MRRYPAFDPAEYQNWSADPALVREYGERLKADPERARVVAELGGEQLLGLYAGMIRARLHDYALKRWVKQGVISKAWLGTGEEAVTIGCVHALDRNTDIVGPMIRNAGACHEMGMPIREMLAGYLGTTESPSGGFDLHIGDLKYNVLPPVSPVGDIAPVIAGIALSFKQRREKRVALTWIGDGSTKAGQVHEALNLAAVARVPAIFVIQNNQVALGTRFDQHQAGDFRVWGQAYGMALFEADGNNVLDIFAATRLAADRARAGDGPSILLVETFRMGGHATHDEAEARSTFAAELFDAWGKRDPIGMFEAWLVEDGHATREELEAIEADVIAEIDAAAESALMNRAEKMPAPASAELAGVSAGVRQPGLAPRLGAAV